MEMRNEAVSKVDSRRAVEYTFDVATRPSTCLALPAPMIAGSRHRPSPDIVVAGAIDYSCKLDRELQKMGLRKDERRLFVRSLVVDPLNPVADASMPDVENSGPDELSEVAVLRAALGVESARLRQLQEELSACAAGKDRALGERDTETLRANAAHAAQKQLQDDTRRNKMAWEGRAKHAADAVQSMKRAAKADVATRDQQRDELLSELHAARQHVQRAEHAVAMCDHSKAKMAESFTAMERELRDTRRHALTERTQHELAVRKLQLARDQAETEMQQYRKLSEQQQTNLDSTTIRLRQIEGASQLSRKSNTKMRDDVQSSQLKNLNMESKVAKHNQERKAIEDQLAEANRKIDTESKARLALQRQIQSLARQITRLQTREKSLEAELSSFAAQTEEQQMRIAAESRGRKFFKRLLVDCEAKLTAVLVAVEGKAGRWAAANALVQELLAEARRDDGSKGLHGSLGLMHNFIIERGYCTVEELALSGASSPTMTSAAGSDSQSPLATSTPTFELAGGVEPEVQHVLDNVVAAIEQSQRGTVQ